MGRSKQPTAAAFAWWVRKLGRLVVAHVDQAFPRKRGRTGWASAFILSRWTSDSDTPWRITKLRGTLEGGKPLSLQITSEMSAALQRLWELRTAAGVEPWWGLRVTVSPGGPAVLELDPDPNCAVDPLWFRS